MISDYNQDMIKGFNGINKHSKDFKHHVNKLLVITKTVPSVHSTLFVYVHFFPLEVVQFLTNGGLKMKETKTIQKQ